MATTKISALPAATTADAADLTIAVNASSDEKATVTQIATYSRALTGATTASAIVGSGSSLIINTALADSDTRIAGTTSATLFFVDAGLDKVGIATAVPTQKLDVTGTVNATLFSGSGASITGISGNATAFRTVASDPSPLVNGDVWYNSTSDTFKGALLATAWATTGSISTATNDSAGCGTVSAALNIGGNTAAGITVVCESFNGATWASTGSLNTSVYDHAACGTTSSALQAGGYVGGPSTLTQKFNGTTWSTSGSLAAGRFQPGMAGASSTSALIFGGRGPATLSSCELFNGTSWSASTALNTAQRSQAHAGIATAAIYTGNSANQTWNGSSWATGATPVLPRSNCAGCGTTTSTMIMGGSDAVGATNSESFNGTAWSTLATLVQKREYLAAAGASNSSGMVIAGNLNVAPNTIFASAEIYGPVATAKTFTVT